MHASNSTLPAKTSATQARVNSVCYEARNACLRVYTVVIIYGSLLRITCALASCAGGSRGQTSSCKTAPGSGQYCKGTSLHEHKGLVSALIVSFLPRPIPDGVCPLPAPDTYSASLQPVLGEACVSFTCSAFLRAVSSPLMSVFEGFARRCRPCSCLARTECSICSASGGFADGCFPPGLLLLRLFLSLLQLLLVQQGKCATFDLVHHM